MTNETNQEEQRWRLYKLAAEAYRDALESWDAFKDAKAKAEMALQTAQASARGEKK